MRVVSVFFIAGVALSVGIPHSTFRYELSKSFRRDGDICHFCYGDECITVNESWCQYLVVVDEIIEKPPEDGQVTEVDAMMYDLAEQAERSWTVQRCLPLISEYTNCNKENICIGCKTCSCSGAGQWICSDVQHCKPEIQLDVNHRILVMVMEKLNELKNIEMGRGQRVKRMVSSSSTIKPVVKHMNLRDIAEWMYGLKPNIINKLENHTNNVTISTTASYNHTEPITSTKSTHKASTKITDTVPTKATKFTQESTTESIKSTTPAEPDYLDFAEVLKNIAIEEQSYKRRKSPLKTNEDTTIDINHYKINNGSNSERFIQVLTALEDFSDVTESEIDEATFVVDLFPKVFNRNNYHHDDTKDVFDISNVINKELYGKFGPEISNERNELNAINVKKRDVSPVTDKTNTTHLTYTTSSTSEASTDTEGVILENVLTPLANIIDDKIHEVKELIQIRERLIHFIKNHDMTALNVTKDSDFINASNTQVDIYNLDLFPEIQQNLRRTNTNVIEKLLYKLKRDIYEVLKDIARIQTISKTYGLPNDLKIMVRSMQRFIHTQIDLQKFGNKSLNHEQTQLTRKMNIIDNFNYGHTASYNSVYNQLLAILDVIDRNKPNSNGLFYLSMSIKKILKRVINQNYIDEFHREGPKMLYDKESSLINAIKLIGISWPPLVANLKNSLPYDKLYPLKLLHLTLINDLKIATDVKSFVEFSFSRRMIPIGVRTAETVIDSISAGLNSLKNKILQLIQYHTVVDSPLRENTITKSKKKNSFFKKIRNLLRNSKIDVFNMVKKKPRTQPLDLEVANNYAEPQLDELKEPNDEKTMLKWQKYLSMARRKKRELNSHLRGKNNMIKSIIPKYLQGKINPALVKNHKREKPRGSQH